MTSEGRVMLEEILTMKREEDLLGTSEEIETFKREDPEMTSEVHVMLGKIQIMIRDHLQEKYAGNETSMGPEIEKADGEEEIGDLKETEMAGEEVQVEMEVGVEMKEDGVTEEMREGLLLEMEVGMTGGVETDSPEMNHVVVVVVAAGETGEMMDHPGDHLAMTLAETKVVGGVVVLLMTEEADLTEKNVVGHLVEEIVRIPGGEVMLLLEERLHHHNREMVDKNSNMMTAGPQLSNVNLFPTCISFPRYALTYYFYF